MKFGGLPAPKSESSSEDPDQTQNENENSLVRHDDDKAELEDDPVH